MNSRVHSRGLLAILSFTAASLAFADQPVTEVSLDQLSRYRPEMIDPSDSATLLQSLPMLAYLEPLVPAEAAELGPAPVAFEQTSPRLVVHTAAKQNVSKTLADSKDVTKAIQSSPRHPLYYSGEVGAYVGHASGKVHGDAFGSYFESTVGDEHLQITVGASYDQFNGRGPRRGW